MKYLKQQMIEAIFAAHEVNQKVIAFIDTIVAECGKPKHAYDKLCSAGRTVCRNQRDRSSGQKWKKPYLQMINRQEKKISVLITQKLEEAFAENEEWLAVLGEAVYQYQKKTVTKDDLKRSQTSGWTSDRPDHDRLPQK